MDVLPIRVIIVLVALESFLSGFQEGLIRNYSDQNENYKKIEGFFLTILSFVATIVTALYLQTLKTGGRRAFLVKCTSILAFCFLLSVVFIKAGLTAFLILHIFISVLQSAGRTGLLSSILSVVSIQTGEIGFFFGVQMFVIQFFIIFGYVTYSIYEKEDDEADMLKFFFFIIVLFAFVSYYIYRNLSERHDQRKSYSMHLWLDIFKVKAFNFDFIAFSLSLGVGQFTFLKTLYSVDEQPLGVAIFTMILALFSYPITLYFVYKYMRPLENRVFIVAGLCLQSIGMFTLTVFYSDFDDYYKLIGLLSPLLGQIGSVFVIVSSLPDMLETVASKLPGVEFGAISDRICSTIFVAYFKGIITIFILTTILEIFTDFIPAVVITSFFILGFALVYEYNVRGVWEYFKGRSDRRIVNEVEMNKSADFSYLSSS